MQLIIKVFGALLCLIATAFAQFTTVTGTITDPNGLAYAGGTISATLVSSASPVFTATKLPYTPPIQPTGLSANGSFVMSLADVTTLTPGGSTYTFNVCSGPNATVFPAFGKGPVCFTATAVSISGASQSITATLNAVALALTVPFGAGAGCGSGTTNTIMMFTGSTTCGNSPLTVSGNLISLPATGRWQNYQGQLSVGNGMAQVVGIQQGAGFIANMTATQIGPTVPASAHQFYRVNCYLVITVAASSSSTLPSCQVSWTDANTSVVETATFSPTNTGNTVGTFVQGTIFLNPNPGTAISVSTTGYASNPAATMTYVNGFDIESL